MVAGRKRGWRDAFKQAHLRQFVLFLLAVLLPASAVIFLSLRTIAQERELTRNRLRDDRERAARHFGQELLEELDRCKKQFDGPAPGKSVASKAAPPRAAVVMVAWVEGDALTLPWEVDRRAAFGADDGGESSFGKLVWEAERLELHQGEFGSAASTYRQAIATGQTPAEKALARLGVARALSKAGRGDDTREELLQVLRLPPDVRDEFGVPMAFYAAGGIAKAGDPSAALGPVRAAVESGVVLSPAALYMARHFAQAASADGQASAAGLLRHLSDRIREAEQAQKLKSEFPLVRAGLGRRSSDGNDVRWLLYGDPAWLVGFGGPGTAGATTLCAVDADAICRRLFRERGFDRLGYGGAALVRGGEGGDGVWLGEAFPNARVRFSAGADVDGSLRAASGFYWALVAAVLGITTFGSYLWWRDTRREFRLAGLRSDFISSVSHELKTPLTSIRMFAETLRFRRASEARQTEYLDTILAETERLSRLLANVLDFSRIERGDKRYDLRPAELRAIVESSVGAVQQPVREQGFEVDLTLPDGPVPLHADRDALEQALVNLLANAIKYSGDNRRIEVRVSAGDGGARVVVRDHGVGIHPREHRRVFERYYRTPEAHNGKIPGTGLGLSLVKHIVEGHGGRVGVESSPGKGAAFTVWLPAGSHT